MKNFISFIEIKWGFIFFGTVLVWMMFEKLMGWHDINIASHATLTNFFAIPAISIYVFGLLEIRKKTYQGNMAWKKGFIAGLKITLIATLFSPIAQLIVSYVITPDYFTNIIKYSVEVQNKNREEMEAYFNIKNYLLQSFVGSAIMGTITSAFVALATKKWK